MEKGLAQIMGILNITPDSFSDGGSFEKADAAIAKAKAMIADGAQILDLGAESSAPGSAEVPEKEEWRRLGSVLKEVVRLNVLVSVDTWKAATAEKALSFGASMINDITSARGDPRMWEVLKSSDCQVVFMFSKDASARTTLQKTAYADPIATVKEFFLQLLQTAEKKSVDPARIILDPGMGAFLSTDPAVSFQVLNRLHELVSAFPGNRILIGTSRKGFLREVSKGKEPQERTIASVVTALAAARRGASILRVHDVRETREALLTDLAVEYAG